MQTQLLIQQQSASQYPRILYVRDDTFTLEHYHLRGWDHIGVNQWFSTFSLHRANCGDADTTAGHELPELANYYN